MLYDLILIIVIATILAGVFWRLRQPPILAYLITGMILGPSFLGILEDYTAITILSDLGIAFLLFLVGMELNFNKMKSVGLVSLVIGAAQIIFTCAIVYLLSLGLGFSSFQSVYIAIALTFSSTIIIIKLLSEKNDLDTLYGRIAIGLLLVQDFAAILVILFLNMFGFAGAITANMIGKTVLSVVGLFALAILLSKYLLHSLFNIIAKSQELLFLASISWCFLFIYASLLFGFSIQIGAFLAGITLAPLPFCYEIIGKIKPLRDFFIVIFFVLLGMQMLFSPKMLMPVIILSLFVLIGKPLIVMILMSLLCYRKRTSFFTSLATAQISEFSLILTALGLSLGHISLSVSSLITSVGIITIAASSYMITFNEKLYKIFSPMLNIFERRLLREEAGEAKCMKNHVIIIGCHRMGYTIAEALKKMRKRILVIDFNPDIIKMLKERKIAYIYGDATDTEILHRANIMNSRLVISTIPDIDESILLIKESKKYNIPIIVTANQLREAEELYKAGADYVILPHFLGGERTSILLKRFLKNTKIISRTKKKHIEYLRSRSKLGHY